jgi:hypothetical protein
MPTYAQNKAAIYRWNEKNPDYGKEYKSKYIEKNRDKINKYRLNWYYTQKEFKAFRMILIN